MSCNWVINSKVWSSSKQSTTIQVWYEVPLPSGKNVTLLSGTVHSLI